MTENTSDAENAPDINPIITEMHTQNDRGAAICGCAFLEEKLREAIEERWPPISNAVRERLFKGFGSLSSFSAKITLAHAMGVLATSAKSDFNKARLIRNDAAHIGTPFSFETPQTKKRVGELVAMIHGMPPDKFPGNTERNLFTGSVKMMSAYLWMQNRWKEKLGPNAVMPYFDGPQSSKNQRVNSTSESKCES